jgi:dephospho-CoA kinase
MSPGRPILKTGLTGGIASGKTTVAGFLSELGAFVIDADAIAHDAISPGGEAFDEVVERFGPGILDPQGRIQRTALGQIVFRDAEARRSLNEIVHPRVIAETDRRIGRYLLTGHAPVSVVDAALLVEAGMFRTFERLIVVRCSPDVQLRRLLARGLDPKEALLRIDAQAPLEDKLAVADYVVDTETTLHETRKQTEAVYAALLSDFEKKYGEPGERRPG